MFVVTHRKIFYAISSILVILSIISFFVFGLNFGIDFKGGSVLELSYAPIGTVANGSGSGRPDLNTIQSEVDSQNLGPSSVRPTGSDGYIISLRALTEPERNSLVTTLTATTSTSTSAASVKRFDSVGPILGKELQGKAIISIILVIIAIVLFITFAFRKVSKPVSSWKYGGVAIIALIHDVIVPTGFFSFFGHFYGFQVDTLFVTAILVVLGFSVHDTIVVFDRVRENLKHKKADESFEQVVGGSISQTFTRSINTSVTVLLSLIVLYIFGAEATRDFSLVLFVGILAGTYSSIFLGSPLLVTLEKLRSKKKR